MHIPDGILSNRISLSLDVLSAATLGYASARVEAGLGGRAVPLMGVLGAFVFAVQMLNFPVLGGTSGHLVGGALLGIVLGPMAAFVTMSTVVIAQALFLQDGGIVALGANIFNIAALSAFTGHAVFRVMGGTSGSRGVVLAAAFLAGWLSLVVAAVSCALQLALSGTVAASIGIPAMAGYHAVIGVAEGGLTAGVISFLARVRPDLLKRDRSGRFSAADWAGALLFVAIPFAILVFLGTSELPDPLERLLGSSPASAAPPELVTPARFRDWTGQLGVLTLLVAIAYAIARFVPKSRSGS